MHKILKGQLGKNRMETSGRTDTTDCITFSTNAIRNNFSTEFYNGCQTSDRDSVETIGADVHRAMVATAPGEKVLTGRRPVRNWTSRTIPSLILCRKSHLLLGKSTKTAATRATLFDSNMHQIVCRLGLRFRPTRGAYGAPPHP